MQELLQPVAQRRRSGGGAEEERRRSGGGAGEGGKLHKLVVPHPLWSCLTPPSQTPK